MIGADVATQSGLQDISVMRSLPNFHVYQPCSNLETTQIIDHVSKLDKPAYVRIARNVIPEFLPKNYKFKFKKLTTIKNGKKIAIISSGPMLYNCFKAIEKIKDKEKFALLNLSTIKPLNEKQIIQKLKKFQRIVTVEDHTIEGGIGSVIAEVMSNSAHPKKIQMLGITNKFINSDNPTNLEKKFKLDINNLYKIIKIF